MSNYVISEILKSRKITDYLAQKGHNPVGQMMNGKLKYRCPIHKGDNTPSFIVYLNGEFENYFCYGCKARYHIIHLFRDLENVSTEEAIKALANGLDLNVDAEIAHAIREINEDRSLMQEVTVVDAALALNKMLYGFLKKVNFEATCVQSAEQMYQMIDKLIDAGDVTGLKKLEDPLTDAIIRKIRWYQDLEEQRIRDLVKRQ